MPPSDGKALYSSTCVFVSEEGFRSPSTTLFSISTTTIFSGVRSLYSTPEGLMTISPLFRSMPDTFPHVQTTNPRSGSSMLAR